MNYIKLRAELDSNPTLYAALTDQQVADELNAVDKVQTRTSISGSELFSYTDETEYNALADSKKSQWLSLCAIDSVTSSAVPIIKSIFPANTATWGNIVKTETVSRAAQEGLGGNIQENDITIARAQ